MEYKLIRSKRKTLTVCIEDGDVIVKAPERMSVGHIEAFLTKKSAWVEKKLAEQRGKARALESVLNGSCVLYHGAEKKVTVSDAHKRVSLGAEEIFVPLKYAQRTARDRAIAAYLKRLAAAELSQALSDTSALTGLRYSSFALTNAKTKWGSCDGKCNIRLNWRLVMLEPELTEYVIIHELAHTVHHDHSAAFWQTVSERCPDYKTSVKRLKSMSVITSLYR